MPTHRVPFSIYTAGHLDIPTDHVVIKLPSGNVFIEYERNDYNSEPVLKLNVYDISVIGDTIEVLDQWGNTHKYIREGGQ